MTDFPTPTQTSLPDYDTALAQVLQHAPSLQPERVALSEALGRVLWDDVVADRDQPPFHRSAMDGFAVRSAEIAPDPGAGKAFPIAGGVAAGAAPATFQTPMPAGAVMRIATGAPLPEGADAVIQIEKAQVLGDGEQVRFDVGAIRPWNNVHTRASDTAAGASVLRAGTRLAPHHLGIAAAVGAGQVTVAQRPRITVLTTGDEVVAPDTPTDQLEPQQIRNSNGPMLVALLHALGAPPLAHVHVPDEPERTLAAAREALSRSHMVVTVGGVSVGERDYLPTTWPRLGLEPVLHGIAIQPGKPVYAAQADCKLVLGLPGNPVSVLATAHLMLWPVLRKMGREGQGPRAKGQGGDGPRGSGLGPREEQRHEVDLLPWRTVTLAEAAKAKGGRQVFRAATVDAEGQARIVPWHGSGDLMHTATAEGFVRLPLTDDPIPAGTRVAFLPMIGV